MSQRDKKKGDNNDDDSSSSSEEEDEQLPPLTRRKPNKRVMDSDDSSSSSDSSDYDSSMEEEVPTLSRKRPIKKRFALSDSEDDSSSEEDRPPTPKQKPKSKRKAKPKPKQRRKPKPKPKPKAPKDENPNRKGGKQKIMQDPRLPWNKWIKDNPNRGEIQYYDDVARLPPVPPTREERILDAVRDFVANFYVSQLDEVRGQMDRAIRGVRKYLKLKATNAEIQKVLEDEMKQEEYEKYQEDMGLLSSKSKRRKIEYVALILKKEYSADMLKLKKVKRGTSYTYVDPKVESRRKELMNKTNMDGIDALLLQHGYSLDGYAENRRWDKGLEEKAKKEETVTIIFKRLEL